MYRQYAFERWNPISRFELDWSHVPFYIFKVMNIQEFEYNAQGAAALLKALASPLRLMVLCHLAKGEKSVGEIAALTGLSEGNVRVKIHRARCRLRSLLDSEKP